MKDFKEKLGKKQYIKALVNVVKAAPGEDELDVVVATDSVDRTLERINIKGLDIKPYKDNPVVLWGHKYGELPIGKSLAIKKTADGKLQARVKFAVDEYDFAHTVYKLFKGGFLKAFSIGFIPKDYDYDEKSDVIEWTESEMLEFSAVTVPANAEALVMAAQKGVISEKERKLYTDVIDKKKSADDAQVEDYDAEDSTDAAEEGATPPANDDDDRTEQELNEDTQPVNTNPEDENGPQADWATDGDKPAGSPGDEQEERRDREDAQKDEDDTDNADESVSEDDAKTKAKPMSIADLEGYGFATIDFVRDAMNEMEKLMKDNIKDSSQGRAGVQKRRVRLVKARGILQLVDKAGEGLNREIKSSVKRRKVKLVTREEKSHA